MGDVPQAKNPSPFPFQGEGDTGGEGFQSQTSEGRAITSSYKVWQEISIKTIMVGMQVRFETRAGLVLSFGR